MWIFSLSKKVSFLYAVQQEIDRLKSEKRNTDNSYKIYSNGGPHLPVHAHETLLA